MGDERKILKYHNATRDKIKAHKRRISRILMGGE